MSARLRQIVLAAADIDPVAERLEAELGLREPFHDFGVSAFGLRNAVWALGDDFIEVITPAQEDTAVNRWLARHGGDGGYMLIFQLDDLDAARARAEGAGIRVVWQADLEDISGTHLHPADMRGALVSIDSATPPESWRWGGPEWIGKAGEGAPGRILGVTVAGADRSRWDHVLGGTPPSVAFAGGPEGVTDVRVAVPGGERPAVEIGGVRFHFEAEEAM
jgi:hypothetical protein